MGLLRSSPSERQISLELGRRSIGQSRMQAVAVVDLLDEGTDLDARMMRVAIGAAVDLLVLECLDEALRLCVVVGVSRHGSFWAGCRALPAIRYSRCMRIGHRDRSGGSGRQASAC